ncbi:MBL fold metallo-hydrolase [Agromyces endophyticus]|uniref:MBL fold metallo-hydrolase n=1 Tax=Agromyces sp. H17E-10 TaxID=2932244 RepID=UPI001FD5C0CF|nr:MBL fold metallo-hydrolase [Agromyces sp. H17E-10]UOQ90066.1 MBL fold metallo-hydrolase [Agromyces sp. H17E-10]
MEEPTAPTHVDPSGPTRFARAVLAPNPGPMTLDGTNSYLLQAPGTRSTIVVDPGPADAGHLELLAALPVELVLITHHHADHTEAIDAFARMTGAPVRAIDPAFCRDADPLIDGERITAAGIELEVVATPGHTADSACFALVGEAPAAPGTGVVPAAPPSPLAVLTGDTVLGRGTTIIADPDGALGAYLDSLERLRSLGTPGPVAVLPGHGPALPDLAAICGAYLAHRAERLDQVRAALARLGVDAAAASVGAVTDVVYADTDAAVRGAAEASMRAQLKYLRDRR